MGLHETALALVPGFRPAFFMLSHVPMLFCLLTSPRPLLFLYCPPLSLPFVFTFLGEDSDF